MFQPQNLFNIRFWGAKVRKKNETTKGMGIILITIVNLWNPFELVSSEIAFLWCTGVTMPICKGRTPVVPLKIG